MRAKVSKMQIMQKLMFQDDVPVDSLMHPFHLTPETKFKGMVTEFKKHMRGKMKVMKQRRLYHPGRIIHLRKVGLEPAGCCSPLTGSSRRVFAPFVTSMKYFSDITISSSMVMDHLPDRYVAALNVLVKDWAEERRKRREE